MAAVVGEGEFVDSAGEGQAFFDDSAGELDDLHFGGGSVFPIIPRLMMRTNTLPADAQTVVVRSCSERFLTGVYCRAADV